MHFVFRKSSAPSGATAMTTNDPAMQSKIGQREGFSEKDLIEINKRYCGYIN